MFQISPPAAPQFLGCIFFIHRLYSEPEDENYPASSSNVHPAAPFKFKKATVMNAQGPVSNNAGNASSEDDVKRQAERTEKGSKMFDWN